MRFYAEDDWRGDITEKFMAIAAGVMGVCAVMGALQVADSYFPSWIYSVRLPSRLREWIETDHRKRQELERLKNALKLIKSLRDLESRINSDSMRQYVNFTVVNLIPLVLATSRNFQPWTHEWCSALFLASQQSGWQKFNDFTLRQGGQSNALVENIVSITGLTPTQEQRESYDEWAAAANWLLDKGRGEPVDATDTQAIADDWSEALISSSEYRQKMARAVPRLRGHLHARGLPKEMRELVLSYASPTVEFKDGEREETTQEPEPEPESVAASSSSSADSASSSSSSSTGSRRTRWGPRHQWATIRFVPPNAKSNVFPLPPEDQASTQGGMMSRAAGRVFRANRTDLESALPAPLERVYDVHRIKQLTTDVINDLMLPSANEEMSRKKLKQWVPLVYAISKKTTPWGDEFNTLYFDLLKEEGLLKEFVSPSSGIFNQSAMRGEAVVLAIEHITGVKPNEEQKRAFQKRNTEMATTLRGQFSSSDSMLRFALR